MGIFHEAFVDRRMALIRKHILIIIVALAIVMSLTTATAAASDSQNTTTEHAGRSELGEIDQAIFSRSIPELMMVGERYTVTMLVTNTGALPSKFWLVLDFPYSQTNKYFFYSGDLAWLLTLDAGASSRVQVALVPQIEYVGKLTLTASLYQVASTYPTQQLSTVSASVSQIRLRIPAQSSLAIIASALLIACAISVVRLRRKVNHPLAYAAPVSLFLLALALRASNLMNVGIYWDEVKFWQSSQVILADGWTWSQQLMSQPFPPLFYYLEAVITCLFGSRFDAFRTISVFAGAATVLPVYALANELFGHRVALVSGLMFSTYGQHVLLSKISRMEALVLLLMMVALYLFWVGYKQKNLLQMATSGILLGIAFDTKYIVGVQLLALVIFVVWTGRSWKPLLERRFLVALTSFLAITVPVQLMIFYSTRMVPYLTYFRSNVVLIWAVKEPQGLLLLSDYVFKLLRMHLYVIGRSGSPWLPWLHLYEIVILMLLLVVPAYYALPFLRGRRKEVFIMTNFLVFVVAFVVGHARNWWIVYEMPWFLIMTCNFGVDLATSLRSPLLKLPRLQTIGRYGTRGAVRAAALMLVTIFVISEVSTGFVVSSVDKGDEGAAIESAMSFVRIHARPGDVLAHIDYIEIKYYINSFELNVTLIPIYVSAQNKYIISETLFQLKPRFLIIARSFFQGGTNATSKLSIFKEYAIAYVAQAQTGYVWTGSLWGAGVTDNFVYLVFVRRADWI